MDKIKVGIIGSGNIGTDLLLKLLRSESLEPAMVVGVDPDSEGLAIARSKGVAASADGIDALLPNEDIRIVFDASGAKPHLRHAKLLEKAGMLAVDLTPAAVGPFVVPYVNVQAHLDVPNINLITCGGQATIPIVWAINQVCPVSYAEIVSSVSSRSAGIGTRQNIDEFTHTTARSLEQVGGAKRGKAIIVLNPAEPPIMMRNTIFALVDEPRADEIRGSVERMVEQIQGYVPGYRLKHRPDVDGNKVTVQIQVTGAGDYLPSYAGNLDIMTAAAVAVGEELARTLTAKETAVQ